MAAVSMNITHTDTDIKTCLEAAVTKIQGRRPLARLALSGRKPGPSEIYS